MGAVTLPLENAAIQVTFTPKSSEFAISVETVPPKYLDMTQPGEMLDYIDACLVAGGAPLYQSGGSIVHPVRIDRASDFSDEAIRRREGALLLDRVTTKRMVEYIAASTNFIRWDGRKRRDVLARIPLELASAYLERRDRWNLRVLDGIVECPVLRADGSVLAQGGYDEVSRLFVDLGGVKYPDIPREPTKEDALAALAFLKEPFREFPFVPDDPDEPQRSASRSVALAFVLTAVCRRMLPSAPIFGFSAPTKGSGKTLAVDVASIITTGRDGAYVTKGSSEDEDEKRLSAMLRSGDQMVVIDNSRRPIKGDALCIALTAPTWKARLLGENETVVLKTNVLFAATGNGLIFQGDVTRRALLCRLDAGVENPETRRFERTNLKEWIREHRAELTAAALTVLRAYRVSGERAEPRAFGGFDAWNDTVAGALVWLGEPDPNITREQIRQNDPDRGVETELFQALHKNFGEEWVRPNAAYLKLNSTFGGAAVLRNANVSSGKSLGWRLKGLEGKISDGFRLHARWDSGNKANVYRLVAL
ncbi:hypothetical protein [Bradyrhizobium sp. S3.2.12]|uniref:hypothetical protein n=1 Tax=Bradyrhizobium sp. S3.2.12 TaxID=3156387 RepID=UPI003393BEA3